VRRSLTKWADASISPTRGRRTLQWPALDRMNVLAGVVLIAAVSTLGDFVWYTFGVRHTVWAAVTHGAVLLTSVGAVLGNARGRVAKGLPIGALAGIGGALWYYLLVLTVDSRPYGAAIPGAWLFMWLLLAVLDGRWLRAPDCSGWRDIALRGTLAACAGGLSFALVWQRLWGRPAGQRQGYALQFAVWTFAWAPGLLVLVWGGGAGSIEPVELAKRIDRGEPLEILDVRSEREFAAGHIPGALNVPFNQVSRRASGVARTTDRELVVYCGHGPRAYIAALALRRNGRRRIVYLNGHFARWQQLALPLERPENL
jgi:phage shock protein E